MGEAPKVAEKPAGDRVKVIAAVVLLVVAIAVPLAVLALTSGGGDDPGRSRLKVETYPNPMTGGLELVVSVEDVEINRPETATRPGIVGLECKNAGGQVVLGGDQEWPFDNDLGMELPHAHLPIRSELADSLATCRLTGTKVPLEGRLTALPAN